MAFFSREVAFLATLSPWTGQQRRQVQVEPQPVLGKIVLIDLPGPAQQGFVGLAHLADLVWTTGIQNAGHRRLFGEPSPPPSLGQQGIGADGRVDLSHDLTPRQEAHAQVEQHADGVLAVGRLRKVNTAADRSPEIMRAYEEAQSDQRPKHGAGLHRCDRKPRNHGYSSLVISIDQGKYTTPFGC